MHTPNTQTECNSVDLETITRQGFYPEVKSRLSSLRERAAISSTPVPVPAWKPQLGESLSGFFLGWQSLSYPYKFYRAIEPPPEDSWQILVLDESGRVYGIQRTPELKDQLRREGFKFSHCGLAGNLMVIAFEGIRVSKDHVPYRHYSVVIDELNDVQLKNSILELLK
ncbi:hypothetical protein [Methylomicrobium lacus]|uniref:hypothetical protein n=1 Tax=Methylomicrobium lacus TaxID=136992 RepID=UPI0035A8647B